MPRLLPQDLPASDILKNEQIFVMDRERAGMQDIRPLEVIIVNLMPTKIQTETQLLRRVSNIALQVIRVWNIWSDFILFLKKFATKNMMR